MIFRTKARRWLSELGGYKPTVFPRKLFFYTVKYRKFQIVAAIIFSLWVKNLYTFLTRLRKLLKERNYSRKYSMWLLLRHNLTTRTHHPPDWKRMNVSTNQNLMGTGPRVLIVIRTLPVRLWAYGKLWTSCFNSATFRIELDYVFFYSFLKMVQSELTTMNVSTCQNLMGTGLNVLIRTRQVRPLAYGKLDKLF